MNDPFDLARFVEAQQRDYQQALDELRAGAKRSHWIWYVFPQLRGLGRSEMAEHYGISGLDEAQVQGRGGGRLTGDRVDDVVEQDVDRLVQSARMERTTIGDLE